MLLADVKKLSPFDRLVYFMTERESIRRKRALGLPAPWTDDEILRTYKFTNCRRMDDRVSRWLWAKWYKPNRNHPNMVAACTLARQLNNPDSLDAVGFPLTWDAEEVERVLTERAAAGLKNFSAAYMVTGALGGTKVQQVVRKVVTPVVLHPPAIDTSSMERSVEALVPYAGFSYFMAGQVVADMRWAWVGTWKDKHTWAPMGPGSRRGMNRLMGRPTAAPLKRDHFLAELRGLIDRLRPCLPDDLTKKLEAIDYQNCCCELDKMERALWGEGRPKQLYRGGAGT